MNVTAILLPNVNVKRPYMCVTERHRTIIMSYHQMKTVILFLCLCVFIYSLTFCQSNELLGKMEVKSTF